MYRIAVRRGGSYGGGNKRWEDLGEGPWRTFEDAIDFASAEVGIPWKIQRRSRAGGRWSTVRVGKGERPAAGDASGRFRNRSNPRRRGRRRNQDWRGSIEARIRSAFGFGYAEGEASIRHDEAGRRFHHESWRKWLSAYGDTPALKRQLEDSHRAGYTEAASYGRGNPARRAGGRMFMVNSKRFKGTIVQRTDGSVRILGRGGRR